MYYFETNALYQLASLLRDFPALASDVCSSFLAILELLSGLTENNWLVRKRILSTLQSNSILIATATPAEILTAGFDCVELNAQGHRDRIAKLAEVVGETESYSQAQSQLQELGATTLDDLKSDDQFIRDHGELIGNGVRYRNDVPRESRVRIREAYEASASQDFAQRYETARQEYIHRLAIMFASKLFPEEVDHTTSVAEIEDSYNGLCDDFFTAKAFLETEHILEGINPGKNDNFDIAHLIYVGPNILVTDDKKLLSIANSIRGGMAISVSELRSTLARQEASCTEGPSFPSVSQASRDSITTRRM